MDRPSGRTQNGHNGDGVNARPQKPEPESRRPSEIKPPKFTLKELQTMLYLEKVEVGAMESLLTRSDLSEDVKLKIARARRLKHEAIGLAESIVKEEIKDRRAKATDKNDSAARRRSQDRQATAVQEMRRVQSDSPRRQSGDRRPSHERSASGEAAGGPAERQSSRSAEHLKSGETDKPRRKSTESTERTRSLSSGQRAHLRASSTPQVDGNGRGGNGSTNTEPSTSSTEQRASSSSSSKLSVRTIELLRDPAVPGGLIRHSSLPPRYPSVGALTKGSSGSPASQGSSSLTTNSSREGRRSRDGDGAGTGKSVGFDLQEPTRNGGGSSGNGSGSGSGLGPGPGTSGGSGDLSRFGSVAELLAKRSSKRESKDS